MQGRERHVSGRGSGVSRRGSGLGTGPAGSGGRGGGHHSGRNRAIGGGSILAVIIFLLVSFLGGGNTGSSSSGSVFQDGGQWNRDSNDGVLNREVADGSRDKFTVLKKDGSDTATVMVYMCGADLESQNGMGTADIQEMCRAEESDNVHVMLYTGGSTKWQNSTVSAQTNEIFSIENGGLKKLKDAGDQCMTDPSTLSSFIQYCAETHPANRYELIFWDHGGGSSTGYGYDEKHAQEGSMDLSQIREAVVNGGVKFDFIGFDACLMAAAENALALSDQADYLIASEETEPGTGWYYTGWLSDLSKDPGMSTLDMGKEIADDFTDANNDGWSQTTLSVVDLAEFANTFPEQFSKFADETVKEINSDAYQKVSNARANTREFDASQHIDQVDLVDLADQIDNQSGRLLADKLLSCVKYNRVNGITNAYGLSVYFPYARLNKVDAMADTYEDIGVSDSYTDCIRCFAKMEASGQAASGSTGIFDLLNGGSYQTISSDEIGNLISQMFASGGRALNLENGEFLEKASLSDEDAISQVQSRRIDTSELVWNETDEGYQMSLSEDNWDNVQRLEKSLYVDDGSGYIDLGLDNQFDIDDDGNLIADTEGTWLAIDNQPVPYYYMSTSEDGDESTIVGRVPALRNGEYVNLILVFDDEHPSGTVAGYIRDYREGETETSGKSMLQLEEGDVIDYVADYYSYDGTYEDSYMVGSETVYDGSFEVSDVIVPEKISECYRLQDLYGNDYWTPVIELDNR